MKKDHHRGQMDTHETVSMEMYGQWEYFAWNVVYFSVSDSISTVSYEGTSESIVATVTCLCRCYKTTQPLSFQPVAATL